MSDLEQVITRLNRIDTRLDELQKAVVTMARVEEKLSLNADAHSRMWKVIEEHALRIHNLEMKEASASWLERVAWIVVAAVIAGIAWMVRR